ncbi:MAG: zinc-ribbon domain containing protein [Arenimonas sp.]
MKTKNLSARVPADPTQWSEESRRSVASDFITEYVDVHYQCWHCRAEAIYPAADQKHAFEVKKANISQRRLLCGPCWQASCKIASELESNQAKWATTKTILKTDKAFISGWLSLLLEQETYVPYRHDTARKNMLRNLLSDV